MSEKKEPRQSQRKANPNMYDIARWHTALLEATPREVWDAYRADGYTMHQAVAMEASYAG